jgi:L-ascorbate metabolism protein UlaG (beta-lactamase superfamily)
VRITHLGHACVLIEDPAGTAGKVLIDPGSLASDVDQVGAVDAVLVTHEHPDHIDLASLQTLRRANPGLTLYGSPGVCGVLPAEEKERVLLLTGNTSSTTVAGWEVATTTTAHATIYPELPKVLNNSFLLGGHLWHPGDALVDPKRHIDVLLLPIGGPWLKLADAIDYLRAVSPSVAIPIHQGGLAPAHRELHVNLLMKFAPEGTEMLATQPGVAVSL